MENFEIPEKPEYMNRIRKFEEDDPAHADLFNAVVQTLINNDEFLKKVVEQQKETALEKTGDASNTTVTFTSGDSNKPTGYTDVDTIKSGEKQGSLWQKVSLFAKNLRYLWKLCGTSDISGLADGTLTGAVSKLNTDITVRLSDKITLYCVGKYVELDIYDYNISDKIVIPAEYRPLGRPVTEIAIIAHEVGLFTGRVIITGGNMDFYNNNWENVNNSISHYARGSISYIRASGL